MAKPDTPPQGSECSFCGKPFPNVAVGKKAPTHEDNLGRRCIGSGRTTSYAG